MCAFQNSAKYQKGLIVASAILTLLVFGVRLLPHIDSGHLPPEIAFIHTFPYEQELNPGKPLDRAYVYWIHAPVNQVRDELNRSAKGEGIDVVTGEQIKLVQGRCMMLWNDPSDFDPNWSSLLFRPPRTFFERLVDRLAQH